jgi:hypothetical protein
MCAYIMRAAAWGLWSFYCGADDRGHCLFFCTVLPHTWMMRCAPGRLGCAATSSAPGAGRDLDTASCTARSSPHVKMLQRGAVPRSARHMASSTTAAIACTASSDSKRTLKLQQMG